MTGPVDMPPPSVQNKRYVSKLEAALATAQAQAAVMEQALKDVEWIDDSSYGSGCPFCWQAQKHGHDDDCGLANALSAAPKVVWSHKGRVYGMGKGLQVIYTPGCRVEFFSANGVLPKDGWVNVIVLDKQGEGE